MAQAISFGRACAPLKHLFAGSLDEERPVAIVEDRVRTSADLGRAVAGIRLVLQNHPERRWYLSCAKPWEFTASLLALLAEGRVAVIPPNFLPGTCHQLRDVFQAVLSDESRTESRPWLHVPEIPEAPIEPILLEDGELEFFTSGTSGEPKRVCKRLAQLTEEVAVLEHALGEGLEGAVVLGTVPHHHIYGLLFRILWPLLTKRVWRADVSFDPGQLARDLVSAKRAVLVSSPAHLARLHQLLDLRPHRQQVARVFSSGGPLAERDARIYQELLGQPPVEVYGSTETGGIAWRKQEGKASAWTLFPGTCVQLGAEDALVVESVATGGERITLADAASLLPDGRLLLKGRLDRVVKLDGKRVSLPEIEGWLRQHAWVQDAAAVTLDGARARLGVVIVLTPEGRDAFRHGALRIIDGLKQYLLERFEAVTLPRRWRFRDVLPCDERGKRTEHLLRQSFEDKP